MTDHENYSGEAVSPLFYSVSSVNLAITLLSAASRPPSLSALSVHLHIRWES